MDFDKLPLKINRYFILVFRNEIAEKHCKFDLRFLVFGIFLNFLFEINMTPALANQLLVSNYRLPAELPDKYRDFCKGLLSFLPEERIFTDKLKCLAYGTDASFYRMVPKVVAKVAEEGEVSSLLRLAYQLEIAVTFRAAGTSLSGQAITDSVLVLLAGNWTGARVESNGERIALEPGVIGSRANDILKPFGRKFAQIRSPSIPQ